MPSPASDVSATLSFTCSQWQQASAPAQQETDAQPFAALLDANTTAPEAMTAPTNSSQPNPPQAAMQPPAASASSSITWHVDWSGHEASGDAGPGASATGSATASASASANSAATTAPGSGPPPASSPAANATPTDGSFTSPAQWLIEFAHLKTTAANGGNTAATSSRSCNPDPQAIDPYAASATTAHGGKCGPKVAGAGTNTMSPTAPQAGQTAPTATNDATANAEPACAGNDPPPEPDVTATNIVTAANVASADPQSSTPASGTKTPQGDDGDSGRDDAPSPGTVADACSQGQLLINSAQPPIVAAPIAAAVVVSAPVSTPPAPMITSAASAGIGQPSKGHVRALALLAGDQAAPPTSDTPDAAAAKQGQSGKPADSAGSGTPGPIGGDTKAAGPLQAAQTQTTDGDAASPPPDGSGPIDADHPNAQALDPSLAASSGSAAGSSTSGASTSQSAMVGAKAGANGLPNFGFSPSAAATSPGSPPAGPMATPSAAAVPIAGLAVAIAARAQAGSNQFDIRLDPPELGRIDVRLDVDRNGLATTHVTADRADTLNLLQSQQPQLARALEQAGLKTADNGLQFTLRDQSFAGQQNGNGPPAQPNGGSAQLVIPDPDLTPVIATQVYTRLGRGSGVDIRV